MVGASPPYLIVVAGPNGAGKTTFAKKNLKWFIEAHTFLNADEIAREDNPDDVSAVALEAGRKALARRTNLLKARKSLCIETTLAGSSIKRFMRQAKEAGYIVRLIFLFTVSTALNEARVMHRVMSGGHNIPVDVIRRRHARGLERLADCWDVCDEGVIADASSREPYPVLTKEKGKMSVASEAGLAILRDRLVSAGYRVPA